MSKKYPIHFWTALIGAVVIVILIACVMLWPKPGDVDGDGKVTITDYTLIRLERLELRQLTTAEHKRADVNHDGQINNGDITMIKTMILEAQ